MIKMIKSHGCVSNIITLFIEENIYIFTEDLMEMLELKETVIQMAKPKANGVRWYGDVLRRDDGDVLRKALEFEVKGKRKRGQLKKTGKTQVEKVSKSVGLEKEDVLNRARWRVGVGEIAAIVG